MGIQADVLLISELFELILRQFDTISSFDAAALASIARVCKGLSSPSLDALWYTIRSPVPFARLLPADAWNRDDLVYTLLRPIQEGDLLAFDKYARRVRKIDLYTEYASHWHRPPRHLDCQIFRELRALRDPIFPCLKTLHWDPSLARGTTGAFHIISRLGQSPSTELRIEIRDSLDPADYSDDISPPDTIAITHLSDEGLASGWMPEVSTLELSTFYGLLPAQATILQAAVRSLTTLQHIIFDDSLPSGLLAALSNLPHLQSLTVYEDDPSRLLALRMLLSKPQDKFPALEHLKVIVWDGTALDMPLDSIVRTFDLHTVTYDTAQHFAVLRPTRLLETPRPPARAELCGTLQAPERNPVHITVIIPLPVEPVDGAIPVTDFWSILDPVAAHCPNLKCLRVSPDPEYLALDAADIVRLSNNFRNLEILQVIQRRTIRIYLKTLVDIVGLCPRLREIVISLDASSKQTLPAALPDPIPQNALEELEFDAYIPEERDAITAEFLVKMFPKLRSITGRLIARDGWTEVARLVNLARYTV
ncbi:hypothetical protein C8F01DRAFT_1168633 [Mycena amicta]|nr:hypothetical protein C8F01DRAFT_1168633 [Mycena amicta]